jgi:hypothetical protein
MHVLPRVLQPRTQPPCRDGLRCYHASYGSGPQLPIEAGSNTATCPMTPDLTNLPRRAPVLPHVT